MLARCSVFGPMLLYYVRSCLDTFFRSLDLFLRDPPVFQLLPVATACKPWAARGLGTQIVANRLYGMARHLRAWSSQELPRAARDKHGGGIGVSNWIIDF